MRRHPIGQAGVVALSCPGRAKREPGPRATRQTAIQHFVLRTFALGPGSRSASLHSPGTRNGMCAARAPQWIRGRGAVTTAGIRMSAITIFQRTPKRLAAALAMAGTLAAGVAGGYAARYAH